MNPSNPTNNPDELEKTKAKVLYLLKTRKTIPVGYDANELYASMIAEHIHANFVLKDEAESWIRDAHQSFLLSEVEKFDAFDQQKFFAGMFYRWCMGSTNADRVAIKLHNFSVSGEIKGDLTLKATLTNTPKPLGKE